MNHFKKASDRELFLLFSTLFLSMLNSSVALIERIFDNEHYPAFSSFQLRYMVASFTILFSQLPILYTFFFRPRMYYYSFCISAIGVLFFATSLYVQTDFSYVWLWGPWIGANGLAVWRLRLNEDRHSRPIAPPDEPTTTPYGIVFYDKFLVPVETEKSSHSTRYYFASRKDRDWIVNGLIVTVDTNEQIIALEFNSREFGIGRWSSSGSGAIPWESASTGRRKWLTALNQVGPVELERKLVVDILRLLENPALRRAIDDCLAGNVVFWKASFLLPTTDGTL